ncbi:MAG: hypothetical protein M1812_000516 [Candelaria pacifica]|nr:MAG: hypothetical protein M1812_000516 [Candelaria pacifica]
MSSCIAIKLEEDQLIHRMNDYEFELWPRLASRDIFVNAPPAGHPRSLLYTKETAYNFQNLAPARFQTNEFCQREGTMVADRILAWVWFTTRLVSFAHYVPNDEYLKLILDHGDDKKFSVTEQMLVMNELGLFDHYKERIYTHDRPLPSVSRTEPPIEDTVEHEEVNTIEDSLICSWDNSDATTRTVW